MAWREYNPSPTKRLVGDCAVRAVAKALAVDWETAFAKLSANAYQMGDMPSSDAVIGSVLRQNGFYRQAVSDDCPDCYTVADFAVEHPIGTYVLFIGGHVVTVEDGDWYDTWNSGNEHPQYFWYRRE